MGLTVATGKGSQHRVMVPLQFPADFPGAQAAIPQSQDPEALIDAYTGGTYEDGSAGERGQAGILQVGPKKVANGAINEPTGRVLRNEPLLLYPDEHHHFFFAVATLDHDWRPAW